LAWSLHRCGDRRYLDSSSGGINGLIQAFHDKGLGDLVSSWVGTGANLPASGGEIQQAIGAERIQQFASSAGVSPETASNSLASILPGIIDKLTPNGTAPEAGLLDQAIGLLKGVASAPERV
jgi:uncharacterized protein YidB (DUF937 family)